MARIENTVFISYRRTNAPWALAIYQELTRHGYDVFFDFTGIGAGDFENVLVSNIRARAHFLLLLTPSAVDPRGQPEDWLRREIEVALESERNIIPVFLDGFDFRKPAAVAYFADSIEPVKRYNALNVYVEYFNEAMVRLRTLYLDVPLDAVLYPVSGAVLQAARDQQKEASGEGNVLPAALTAQVWFERGISAADVSERLHSFTEALRLSPDNANVLNNRGLALRDMGDLESALQDLNRAVLLNPRDSETVNNRGIVWKDKGELDNALHDFGCAIELDPNYASAFNNRALVLRDQGDREGALRDFSEAVRLKPDYPDSYVNRGNLRRMMRDLNGALADFNEAIRLNPYHAGAFNGRGLVRRDRGTLGSASLDYSEAIRYDPQHADAWCNRANVRRIEGDLNGALADLNEAIRIKPAHASALFNRAPVRRDQGDLAGAVEDFARALQLNPALASTPQSVPPS